jgi:hypothetical protein
METLPATDLGSSRCREQESLFRSRLTALEIQVSDELVLHGTSLRFDVAEVPSRIEGRKGRLRFRLTGGNHVRTYTVKQGLKGFNHDLIMERMVGMYRKELEGLNVQRQKDEVVKQAVSDADEINLALGLQPHHFPRVLANKGGVPLIISSPNGLTRAQAEAALKAIYANRPKDEENLH